MKDAWKSMPAWIAAILSLCLALSLLSFTGLFRARVPLEEAGFFHIEKNAFGCPFRYWNPFLEAPVATASPPMLIRALGPGEINESGLKLFIDGKPARKHQSDYGSIAESGGGRFLHVDGGLILSLPERVDGAPCPPCAFEVVFPVRVKTEWILVILASWAGSLAAAGWRSGRFLSGWRGVFLAPAALGILGTALLGADIWGAGKPLRPPRIMLGNDFVYDHDPNLWSEKKALALLTRKQGQSAEEFVRQANLAVHRGMAYTWPESAADPYRIRIPVWENFFLWSFSLFSEKYHHYEFYSHEKALARGVGLCGQQAACLAGFLRKAGLDARMISLSGHVVATVSVAPGKSFILDPSFGVEIPMSLDEAQKNLEATAGFYGKHWPPSLRDKGHSRFVPPCPSCLVLAAYGGEKGRIDPGGIDDYFGGGGTYEIIERSAYALKWPFPLFLICSACVWAALLDSKRVNKRAAEKRKSEERS